MTKTSKPRVILHGSRTREIPLDYPAEFAGVTYDKVTVRRMMPDEVAAFIAGADDGEARLPMFSVPDIVLDALDPDDSDAVNAAMLDMLPRRLQRALRASSAAPAEAAPEVVPVPKP